VSEPAVVFQTESIIRARRNHALLSGLARLAPMKRLKDLEFEWLYRKYLLEFGEADSDIYVATYSKSGTTWMQFILYQLTTDGALDFDHLFDVSPWIWYSAVRNVAPAKTPSPRLLKSHDDYRRFRPGRRGKVIFVVRDGKDVCVSLFHHRKNFKGYTGSFDEHFQDFLNGRDYNWFLHLRPWLQNGAQLPILYVRYEDLKSDFTGQVLRIAHFIGAHPNEECLLRTAERCSFSAMKEQEHRLGPRNTHFTGRRDAPYYVKNPDQFIRKGDVGEGLTVLSQAQLAAYRERFDQLLGGFPLVESYR
jgi:hypothetical protein